MAYAPTGILGPPRPRPSAVPYIQNWMRNLGRQQALRGLLEEAGYGPPSGRVAQKGRTAERMATLGIMTPPRKPKTLGEQIDEREDLTRAELDVRKEFEPTLEEGIERERALGEARWEAGAPGREYAEERVAEAREFQVERAEAAQEAIAGRQAKSQRVLGERTAARAQERAAVEQRKAVGIAERNETLYGQLLELYAKSGIPFNDAQNKAAEAVDAGQAEEEIARVNREITAEKARRQKEAARNLGRLTDQQDLRQIWKRLGKSDQEALELARAGVKPTATERERGKDVYEKAADKLGAKLIQELDLKGKFTTKLSPGGPVAPDVVARIKALSPAELREAIRAGIKSGQWERVRILNDALVGRGQFERPGYPWKSGLLGIESIPLL